MKRIVCLAIAAASALAVLTAQVDYRGTITGGQTPTIAIPVFRGVGNAQNFMGAFNQTLRADVDGAGLFKLVPASLLPLFTPQQPSDFVTPPPVVNNPRPKRGEMARPSTGGGRWMQDWSSPPVSANYLAFGYTADQNNVLVLRGWLDDLRPGVGNPQVLGKTYLGSMDDAGARKVAHEFAADIIAAFGGKATFGTHIYYVHQASVRAPKEIWRMDPDGGNAQQITRFNSLSIEPAVSPDGTRIAFTSYAKGTPGIFVFSVDPVRDLRFYNQVASMNSQPSFTPDGKQIVYSSSAGRCCRIFIANVNGTGFKAVTSSTFIDTEPKVNPKTGQQIVFTSGRSGPEQVYLMNADGGDIQRLTDGTGEASNPAWHPGGQIIAFSWTRGFAAGKFNVFIMDVAKRTYTQLTHDEGKNENPSWAPDGIHLTFMSNRTGSEQIFTMLGDGSQVQRITRQGINYSPVWGM
jgi:TolB protein